MHSEQAEQSQLLWSAAVCGVDNVFLGGCIWGYSDGVSVGSPL